MVKTEDRSSCQEDYRCGHYGILYPFVRTWIFLLHTGQAGRCIRHIFFHQLRFLDRNRIFIVRFLGLSVFP